MLNLFRQFYFNSILQYLTFSFADRNIQLSLIYLRQKIKRRRKCIDSHLDAFYHFKIVSWLYLLTQRFHSVRNSTARRFKASLEIKSNRESERINVIYFNKCGFLQSRKSEAQELYINEVRIIMNKRERSTNIHNIFVKIW